MKLNLWMIGENLEKYHPKFNISDGASRITGVRLWSDAPSFVPEDQFLYLHQRPEGTFLSNGPDRITLLSPDDTTLMNDLLFIFDRYSAWETALWESSARHSLQELVDLAQPMFGNPILLADMSANVLAVSSAYLDVPIHEYWDEAQKTRQVPIALLGSQLTDPEGNASTWSDAPRVHIISSSMRVLGQLIRAEEQSAAVLGILEYSRPLTRSDQELLAIFSSVLSASLRSQPEGRIYRSRANLIKDILKGDLADPEIISRLNIGMEAPWRLILADSPYRTDAVSKRSLLQRIESDGFPSITLYFEPYVVTLLSDNLVEGVLRRLPPDGDGRFWQVAVSLPFSSMLHLRPNFDLAVYTMLRTAGQAGIFHCEACAFDHLLSLAREQLPVQPLLHPALAVLKDQDARKGSQLYETLYQYLLHERSIQAGANAMYVHKNSFLYRLQKIRELTGIDLDDPMTRAYLLISFFLDKK